MRKPALDLDSVMHDLTVGFARDLQALGRPRLQRCTRCGKGETVVPLKGSRKLAQLGKRLERVLRGDLSGEVGT